MTTSCDTFGLSIYLACATVILGAM